MVVLLQQLAAQTPDYHNLTDALLGLLILLLAWLGRMYIKRLDNHLLECNKRAVLNASELQWIGDSLFHVSTKIGVELSDRPER